MVRLKHACTGRETGANWTRSVCCFNFLIQRAQRARASWSVEVDYACPWASRILSARVIKGSIPFSISLFLLNSSTSTGTPLPS